jgi:hypothetical protein
LINHCIVILKYEERQFYPRHARVHSGHEIRRRQMGQRKSGQSCQGPPYISGLLILNDPESGIPIAVMDGTWITAMRSGAASAVAAEYLATPRIVNHWNPGLQGSRSQQPGGDGRPFPPEKGEGFRHQCRTGRKIGRIWL